MLLPLIETSSMSALRLRFCSMMPISHHMTHQSGPADGRSPA